jgi:hypothetical protein
MWYTNSDFECALSSTEIALLATVVNFAVLLIIVPGGIAIEKEGCELPRAHLAYDR